LFFPGPNSFTGEDVVELHIHGGYSVQNDVMRALSEVEESFHIAQPGDFTKRAFLNGKMDLTEVEALSDLLHAQTEQQRLKALNQLEGSLSKVVNEWANDVMYAVAHLTAYIDFGEDSDIEHDIYRLILPKIQNLSEQIRKHLSHSHKGERLRNGVQVALLGPPNAGKSSLLNALARRPVSIVSDIEGTTRDIVEIHLNVAGFAVTVADTAGIREDQKEKCKPNVSQVNDIEREGMIRALDRASNADILILVMDSNNMEANRYCLEQIRLRRTNEQQVILVYNKLDLLDQEQQQSINMKGYFEDNTSHFFVSCKTNEGIDTLVNYIGNCLSDMFSISQRDIASESNLRAVDHQEQLIITRERHRHALQHCLDNLELFLQYCKEIDIAAEYLRQAHGYLASITGHVDTEDILGIVFKEFCMGK
jgi:tRNA modification GTPase